MIIGKNRHIIHQFHFILQRTQRFGEIEIARSMGPQIPNKSTAVKAPQLGESNANLNAIWLGKFESEHFQFLFFFSVFTIYRALTSSSNKNQPPQMGHQDWRRSINPWDQGLGNFIVDALVVRGWMMWEGCYANVVDSLGLGGGGGWGLFVFFLGGSINWTIGVDQGWMAFLVWTLKVRWFFMFDVYDVWHFVVKRNEL